jgi:hypothetical protein
LNVTVLFLRALNLCPTLKIILQRMKLPVVILATALLGTTSASLNITTKLLISSGDLCRNWPQGPSMLVVDSAEDSALNGLPAQPYDIIFPS